VQSTASLFSPYNRNGHKLICIDDRVETIVAMKQREITDIGLVGEQ